MEFISIQNVFKSYPGQSSAPILSAVNLTIREGEFMALMGPSGSGKSTLLTILGAMNRPTQGAVYVDQLDIYALSDAKLSDFRREYLGFVFQQHHLLPYLTALENVMLPLATLRKSDRYKKDKALDLLKRVGLKDKSRRLPNQLSGGEQGRVAIARALVNEPPLLLADEPTGTLDSHTGNEVMQIFRELNNAGQTIFMVTHNADNAEAAHRVLFIRDGRLQPNPASAQHLHSQLEASSALQGQHL